MSKIGIFDSGMGGVTVLKNLLNIYPYNTYIYIADEKYFPYGNKEKDQLLVYARRIVDYFLTRNVETIIIACNTLSSIVLDDLKKEYKNINIVGVIGSTIKRALEYKNKNMLLLATPNTIRSKVYKNGIESKSNNKIFEVETFELASLIENDDPLLEKEVLGYLNRYNNIDVVILGCTHYKLVEDIIKNYDKNLEIICSSDEIVKDLSLGNDSKNEVFVYTTKDNTDFDKKVKKIINIDTQFLDI